jgi:hypothetical protein
MALLDKINEKGQLVRLRATVLPMPTEGRNGVQLTLVQRDPRDLERPKHAVLRLSVNETNNLRKVLDSVAREDFLDE